MTEGSGALHNVRAVKSLFSMEKSRSLQATEAVSTMWNGKKKVFRIL